MDQLSYTVALDSSVLITAASSDTNVTYTEKYLPGRVLLGALAGEYIRKKRLYGKAHEDDTFYHWFLGGGLSFGDLYLQMEESRVARPLPFSLQCEKQGNVVYNLLLQATEAPTKVLPKYGTLIGGCVVCGYPSSRLHFHNWRKDRMKGHSLEGGIFNYEALTEGQSFTGSIRGEQETLQAFWEFFGAKVSLRLGRSCKTEYGASRMILGDIKPIQAPMIDPDDDSLAITLIAPCILENNHGQADPSLATLQAYLSEFLETDKFEITQCFARTTMIESYLAVWGMKHPAVVGWAAGSTFQIEFNGTLNDYDKGLKRLYAQGLGERTLEGFGRVEFNVAKTERYIKETTRRSRVELPQHPLPEMARMIFISTIRERIIESAKYRASQRINDFKDYPTNSLLGRLRMIFSDESLKECPAAFLELEKKKPVRSQLERCNNGHKTLFEEVKTFQCGELFREAQNREGFNRLKQRAGYDPESDMELVKLLYHTYWQVFWAEMRRKKILKEGKGNEQ
jgi:CRISPR-associated protein Csx10